MLNVINEVSRCLLCNDAPCTKSCPKALDPARGIRALLFEDDNAAPSFFNADDCFSCSAPCEKACIHYDFPIRIKELAEKVGPKSCPGKADLSIDFCGVHCENPFFLASSVIANNYEMIAKAFDMGWGGVVFKTVSFLSIKEVSPRFDQVGKEGMPFIGFRNMEQVSEHNLDEDFAVMARLKKDYPSKVIVASIMGADEQEWETLARMSEEAGADMVECNFSCPQMKTRRMGSDVGQNPELVRFYTMAAKRGTSLPVIAKMTPNITHIEEPPYIVTGRVPGYESCQIFLPAAGYRNGYSLTDSDKCNYWSSSMTGFFGATAGICFKTKDSSGEYEIYGMYRKFGLSVRPVFR